MYVGICNALKDRELKSAAANANSVGEVFRRCERRPKCGKCLPDVAEMIDQARGELSAQRLAAE